MTIHKPTEAAPMPDGGQLRETWARIAADPRPARPWRDGAAFPWADPVFSERMLRLHLDQSTHMASRSLPVIRAHVGWLEDRLAEAFGDAAPRRVLDVACGPGLYCHELARRGHRAWGGDVAPAALRHARAPPRPRDWTAGSTPPISRTRTRRCPRTSPASMR
ncbi:MAG: hypothetical protein IPI34_00200 [bacterium]|nr:hypothetical protein [bacterium]